MNSKRPKFHHTTSLRPEGQKLSRAEIDLLRQKIVDLISSKPDKAAKVLTAWVNSVATKTPNKKIG